MLYAGRLMGARRGRVMDGSRTRHAAWSTAAADFAQEASSVPSRAGPVLIHGLTRPMNSFDEVIHEQRAEEGCGRAVCGMWAGHGVVR